MVSRIKQPQQQQNNNNSQSIFNGDYEIGDVENYQTGNNHQYNHQELLMAVIRKSLISGAVEMRSGYYNIKMDRMGNAHNIWIPDTRATFIECVETAENMFISDLDNSAVEKINELKEKLKHIFKDLCVQEKQYWEELHPDIYKNKIRNNIIYRENALNENLPFYNDYLMKKVETKRMILQELIKLSARKQYFGEVSLSA